MKLACSRIAIRLATPFRTSRAVRSDRQTLWVRLSHDGVEGWGEAVPMDTYDQTLRSAEATCEAAANLIGDNPWHGDAVVGRLLERFDDQRATIAAIDAALHDWVGKCLGVPVMHLLGLNPADAPPTSYSIGLGEPAEMAEKAQAARDMPILKIKLGTGDDEAVLAAVRSAAPDKGIRIDANQAWDADTAPDRVRMCERYGVELVEQPVPADALAGLRRLKAARVLPIVADESCIRPADVLRLRDCVDGINVKLEKCGGIREALRMIHLARACGLRVMLGCMVESSLGIAAAAQLAPLADWIDLDGHLLLADEPFEGLGGAHGRLTIAGGPGLGVRLRGDSAIEP